MTEKRKAWMTAIVLAIATIISIVFLVFAMNQKKEAKLWQKKYEEALIDMEEAYKRLEEQDLKLKEALIEAERHRAEAEAAFLELKQKKK